MRKRRILFDVIFAAGYTSGKMLPKLLNFYRITAVLIVLIGGTLSVLLLTVCQSRQGMLFGIGGLLLSVAPLLDVIGRGREARGWNNLAVLALAGWLGLAGWLLYHAPDGRSREGARIQNRYTGEWRYPHAAPGNLLPELDQVLLGLKLAPLVDHLLTEEQAQRVMGLTTEIYQQLEADADFRALGSVLQHGYDDFWTDRTNHGHYFLYIPRSLNRQQPAPTLVFLHGSGGNFKACIWVLAALADELGMVLIAPSFGKGDWAEPGTSRTLRAALDDASTLVRLDPKRKHLLGLSDGGMGVCQAGGEMGAEFRTLMLVSPVLDPVAMDSVEFLEHSNKRPMLVLAGGEDRRVSVTRISEEVTKLRRSRNSVTLEMIADGDHFMFFSHRTRILRRLAEWLRTNG